MIHSRQWRSTRVLPTPREGRQPLCTRYCLQPLHYQPYSAGKGARFDGPCSRSSWRMAILADWMASSTAVPPSRTEREDAESKDPSSSIPPAPVVCFVQHLTFSECTLYALELRGYEATKQQLGVHPTLLILLPCSHVSCTATISNNQMLLTKSLGRINVILAQGPRRRLIYHAAPHPYKRIQYHVMSMTHLLLVSFLNTRTLASNSSRQSKGETEWRPSTRRAFARYKKP